MTKKELNKLKKNLPKNYGEAIAEKCDCSVRLVGMVLNGQRKNIDIVKMAVEMAIEYKAEIDVVSNKIKSL